MLSRSKLWFVRCVGATVLLGAAAGCDLGSLLDVEDPSRIGGDEAETTAQVTALVNGVEGSFVCGYGLYVSMVADLIELDLMNVIGEPQTINRRRPSSLDIWQNDDCSGRGATSGSYIPLSKARWTADNLVSHLEEWTDAEVPQREPRMARALMLAGFSLSGLGAGFCSAALDLGREMSSLELFAEAEDRFDRAIQIGSRLGLTQIVQASTLGRARMRLYQGNTAGALSDAEAIPAGFSFTVPTATTSPEASNRVWWSTRGSNGMQVPQWVRTLTVEGVPDPRVRAVWEGGIGGDGRQYWAPATKYLRQDSPLPVARWAEAQLIIAEIVGGQRAVNIINTLRDTHGLPRFSSTDPQAIRDQVFEERRRELFIEGLRAYDVRRASLPLFPLPDTPYALGIPKFGTYGTATCVPVPAAEIQNNPNFSKK